MKLSDYTGEDAIDLLADILDPASEILADEEVKDAVRGDASKLTIVKLLLKRHKGSILEIMAAVDGENPADYKPNIFRLPVMLLDLMNDEEMLQLFQLQGQNDQDESSGSATENTEGGEE